jgi:hypothetical protein
MDTARALSRKKILPKLPRLPAEVVNTARCCEPTVAKCCRTFVAVAASYKLIAHYTESLS